jgi:hypothetical protein
MRSAGRVAAPGDVAVMDVTAVIPCPIDFGPAGQCFDWGERAVTIDDVKPVRGLTDGRLAGSRLTKQADAGEHDDSVLPRSFFGSGQSSRGPGE